MFSQTTSPLQCSKPVPFSNMSSIYRELISEKKRTRGPAELKKIKVTLNSTMRNFFLRYFFVIKEQSKISFNSLIENFTYSILFFINKSLINNFHSVLFYLLVLPKYYEIVISVAMKFAKKNSICLSTLFFPKIQCFLSTK